MAFNPYEQVALAMSFIAIVALITGGACLWLALRSPHAVSDEAMRTPAE